MSDRLPHSGIEVTEEQHQIIRHLQQRPVTVVSAGAGAGKTYTTVASVIELLASREAQADEFVLITFTNQAADELRRRLQSRMLGQIRRANTARDLEFWQWQQERLSAAFIGTIHRFCKQLLDLYGYAQGVAREASVSTSQRLIKEAIEGRLASLLEADIENPVSRLVTGEVLAEYELRGLLAEMLRDARSRGLDLEAVSAATSAHSDDDWQPLRTELAQLLCQVTADYTTAARQEQQLDPAALLLEADNLLSSNEGPRVIELLATRFRFLFIDEFQDTSETQARIASRLASAINIVLVGDGKQAIYAFAGASQSLLTRFADEHGTTVLPLSLSGRPSRPLLSIQTELFTAMSQRFRGFDQPLQPSARNLEPQDHLPACVLMLAQPDESEHEAVLARRIANLLGQDMQREEGATATAVEPGDIAVLVRTNREAARWAQVLQQQGVLAQSEGGTPLLRRPEIVAMYRFLQLLWRYPDDLSLMEALSTPALREVDLTDAQARVLSYGKQRGQPLTGDFERLYPQHDRLLQDLRTAALTATVPQLLGLIERRCGLKDYYRDGGDEAAAIALDRLRDYARQCFDSDQALTLPMFLQMLRIGIMQGIELRQPSGMGDEKARHVRVMTIHRAKGMEFPIVVIPALETSRSRKGSPRYMLDSSQGLEINLYSHGLKSASSRYWAQLKRERELTLAEEMRLFYVAVTRAQRLLIMVGRLPMPEEEPIDDTGHDGARLDADAGAQSPHARVSTRHAWDLVVSQALGNADPEEHSWQHEVARAWTQMQTHGARLSPLRLAPVS